MQLNEVFPEPGCCIDRRTDAPNPCTNYSCMRLPKGKTCNDCVHLERCMLIFGAKPLDQTCNFFPRKFLQTTLPRQS